MSLLLDDGPDPVVLARVGSHVTEDAQLGDAGVVFWIDSFELWMEGIVASAGETGIALVDLDVRVTLLEVDEMIFAGNPARHVVLDLVNLRRETFMLDESAQRFRVSDNAVLCLRRNEHAGTEAALVVLAGERVHLPGALQVDILALPLVQNGTVLIGIGLHISDMRDMLQLPL